MVPWVGSLLRDSLKFQERLGGESQMSAGDNSKERVRSRQIARKIDIEKLSAIHEMEKTYRKSRLRVALNCRFPSFCRSNPYALFDA